MTHRLHIGTLVAGETADGETAASEPGAPDTDTSTLEPVAAELDARRFNRHTFWCGQSGSGKTYALGVILERLLLDTKLPLLILDPNADFVRLGERKEPRPRSRQRTGSTTGDGADSTDSTDENSADTPAASADPLDDVRVLRATGAGSGADELRVRFLDLPLASRAAVLGLDPIVDRDEYNVLVHLEHRLGVLGRAELIDSLRSNGAQAQHYLASRIENLGVLDWNLWAWGGRSAEDVIDDRPRATVLDLGGFRFPAEPQVAALSVLDHLWARREDRNPILIVIDEAHNVCNPHPVTPVERALTERITQIAAEGRKFGLWLLLSTQRPSKIPVNVLSQCDNLVLMKLAAPRDLAELADIFGTVPPELFAQAMHFGQGRALIAGGFIGSPSLVQVAERLTHEGGSDVPVPL